MRTLIIVILLLATTASAQFKFLGDSTWQTNTKTVRQVRQTYNDLNYFQNRCDSLEDVVTSQQQIIDSTKKQVARLQRFDTLNQERIASLNSVVIELTKPVVITAPSRLLVYEGTFVNLGGYNGFPDEEKNFFKAFRPYASLEPSFLIADKVRLGAELAYMPTPISPQKNLRLSFKVGIKAF